MAAQVAGWSTKYLETPCLLPFDVHAGLGGALLLEQIQAHASQNGEVLGPVTHADAAVVLVERHVQHPVTAVLDAPVRAHRATSKHLILIMRHDNSPQRLTVFYGDSKGDLAAMRAFVVEAFQLAETEVAWEPSQ